MKVGTKIKVSGINLDGKTFYQSATVCRDNERAKSPAGFVLVRFLDGGKLRVHQSRICI